MKKFLHLPAFLVLSSLFAMAQPAGAQTTFVWNGTNGVSADTNWSDTVNWAPNGTPGSSDTVLFTNSPSVGVPGTIDSVVDQNFTITSLIFDDTNGATHTLLIPTGNKLTVNGTLTNGYNVPGVTSLTNAITGPGELDVLGTIQIGLDRGSGTTIFDMSGLNTFKQTNSSGQFYMGYTSVNYPTVNLATNSTIIVATLSVQDSNGQNGRTGVLNLGKGTNVIQASTINVGLSKATATIQFPASAPATAGVSISGTAGGTNRATILLGSSTSGSGSSKGSLLLAGHPATVLASTVTVGTRGNDTGSATGIVTFDNGTFDATSILIAGYTANTGVQTSTGTLTVGGNSTNTATLIVNTLGGGSFVVADATFASGNSVGTFNLNTNATALVYTSITKSSTAGATNTATVNITGGAMNVVSNTVGSASAPIDYFNITNATLTLAIPAGGGAAVTVSNLSLGGGTNIISISSISATLPDYPTVFQVIKYATANGTNAANFNIGAGTLPPAGYTGFISNDVANSAVDVVITGGPALPRKLVWGGTNPNAGNALTSVWDINTTKDWFSNTTAVSYNDNGGQGGDIVSFTDSGATNLVTLTTTVSPTVINVTNNNFNYTINDNSPGYAIAGNGALNKQGSRTLIIDNSGSNTFSGGVTIGAGTVQVGNNDGNGNLGNGPVADNGALIFSRNNTLIAPNAISGTGTVAITAGTINLGGGNSFTGAVTVASGATLQIGNNSALGTTNGSTTIASGATLDVNAHNVGQEQVYISGNGVLNGDSTVNGAIINSSAAGIFPAVARVILLNDTVFGAPTEGTLACSSVLSNRWDLRSASTGDANGASLSTGGNSYNLTKVSLNQVSITGVTVDSMLGNIDIQNGILSIEVATTGLGDPSKTLTVENGATLSIYNATNRFNKNIVLNGYGINNNLGTVNNTAGNNTIGGPVTLNGDVQITFRNAAGAAAGGTLTISNLVTGMSGPGSLTKNDTNTLTVGGLDTHSGGTVVNDGTFILNGMSTAAANSLTINAHTLAVATTLGGNGTNKGPVVVNDTMWPGAGGKPSTFGAGNGTVSPSLQFTPGAVTAVFSLGSTTTAGGGVNDLINVNGDFDAGGANVQINPVGLLTTGVPYTLVNYTGSMLSSSFNQNVNVVPALQPTRYQFSVSYPAHQVQLTVSGQPASLEWNNAAINGLWDVNFSENWSNQVSLTAADKFYNYDTVLFDDNIMNSATPTNIITIATNTAVVPQAITVNATVNYSIVGPGKISGPTSLVKQGSGTLTLAAPNDFTGNTTILAGAVAVTNSSSLGASSGTVFVTNGASLFLNPATTNNGLNFGQKPFVVSGSGIGGNGVIFNSGTNQQNAFQNVTMAGDSTFGGTARWDIRSVVNTNAGATLSTGGQPFKLTKMGSNFIALSSVAVDPALADIDVQAGTLSAETQTTSLGNPANTLTVETGAALELWNNTNILSKVVVLNDGSVLTNGSGNNTFAGPITLKGNPMLNIGGGGLLLSNVVSGTGTLTKNASQTLYLAATNTYTGNTVISNGTLALVGTASINNSTNITLAGGTLDVTGLADDTLTLVPSQTLSGRGTINGNLTNLVGVISLLGTNGTFTVTSNAVLGGIFTNQLGQGSNTVFVANTNLVYGGTLVVTTNAAATTPLTAGSVYRLFKSASYSGTFSSITLPALPTGLGWTNGLAVDGRIGIVNTVLIPTVPATITGFGLSGTNLVINGTNGVNGGTYYVLSSTNVALPLSQWAPVSTNVVNTNGASGNAFSLTGTNVVFTNGVQQFYILSNTN